MRDGDKLNKNPLLNSVTINHNVLGEVIKGGIIRDKDKKIIVMIHQHSPLHRKTKLKK